MAVRPFVLPRGAGLRRAPLDAGAARCGAWLGVALVWVVGCGGSGVGVPAEDADATVDTEAPDGASDPDTHGAVDTAVAADTLDATAHGDADDTRDGDDTTGPDDDTDGSADADGGGDDAGDGGGGDPDGDASACREGSACALQVYPGPCREGRCDADGACVATAIPACCTADADCAAYTVESACETYRCTFSQCTKMAHPGCCTAAIGCDDGLACTVDGCGPDTGLCTHCPVGCSCAPPLLVAGFDGPTLGAGFAIVDDTSWDPVTWRVSQRRAVTPPGAAYLGRADCPNYYTGTLGAGCAPVDPVAQDGARVRVALLSPALPLPADAVSPRATVWLWADVEPVLGLGPAEPDVLRIAVEPVDGSPAWEVGSSLAVGKQTAGGWRLLAFDLTPWRGRSVRLRFTFDTLDGQANAFEGVYLDELRVAEGCEAGGCCDSDADCAPDTGDPCTVARCVSLTSGAGRSCAIVPAHPGDACVPCATAASCEDGDPCTNDTCAPDGACVHEAFCCLRRVVWSNDFEAGLAGWAVADPLLADGVAWSPSSHAFQGAGAAWFGSPATGTYATGAAVRGAITSPPVTLPAAGAVELAFALDLDTEWSGAADYANPGGVDRLVVTILTVQHEIPVWTSDAIAGTTGGGWLPVVADLTPWAGQSVQLRITFDSVDGDANDHGGAFVDAVEVRTSCPNGP